ncbi:MAG: hypothetical protein CMF69_09575 [Magnetovibrio sp.]|nr:hypothetical protein [Magnetovibrio sp.]
MLNICEAAVAVRKQGGKIYRKVQSLISPNTGQSKVTIASRQLKLPDDIFERTMQLDGGATP